MTTMTGRPTPHRAFSALRLAAEALVSPLLRALTAWSRDSLSRPTRADSLPSGLTACPNPPIFFRTSDHRWSSGSAARISLKSGQRQGLQVRVQPRIEFGDQPVVDGVDDT